MVSRSCDKILVDSTKMFWRYLGIAGKLFTSNFEWLWFDVQSRTSKTRCRHCVLSIIVLDQNVNGDERTG